MVASRIGEAIGKQKWVGVVFAGGMCEVPHIRATTLLVNDLHAHVIALATVAADPKEGPKLIRRLRRVVFHPTRLRQAQSRCRDIEGTAPDMVSVEDRLEWAENYFVCVWMGRNGTAGTGGEFTAGLSTRWDAGGGDSVVRFRGATESLKDWRKTLARATFTCLDWREFLKKCKDLPGHCVYADPPWPDDGDSYTHPFTAADHQQLAAALLRFKVARVVVRLNNHPLVRDLYPPSKWAWLDVTGRTMANAAKAEVILSRGG